MIRQLSHRLGSIALAAMLSLAPAMAPGADDSSAPPAPPPPPAPGDSCAPPGLPLPPPPGATGIADGGGYHCRGLAIASPLDAPDGYCCWFYHPKSLFVPYYDSPLTPVSVRWRSTDCHGNPLVVPYYRGYCSWFHRHGPYAIESAALPACGPIGPEAGGFGPYTGAPRDEAILLRLGGNGLLPYGACAPAQPADQVITEKGPAK